MTSPAEPLCHCGRPLHYSTAKKRELVEQVVRECGPYIRVTVGKHTYLVQRHYIALHGLKASELPTLGFEEVRYDAAD